MSLTIAENRIPAMTDQAIEKQRRFEAALREMPQFCLATEHVLHGGMYARTIRIPAGVALAGVFIVVPTMLVFDGCASVNVGNGESAMLRGRHVLAASSNRRQAFLAHEDSTLTMIFATMAHTVDEAEDQFTSEAHLLASREPGALNRIVITGE